MKMAQFSLLGGIIKGNLAIINIIGELESEKTNLKYDNFKGDGTGNSKESNSKIKSK